MEGSHAVGTGTLEQVNMQNVTKELCFVLALTNFWVLGLVKAVVRGRRDRRWVLNHITIPAILQRCLEARQALITLR